MAKNNKKRKNSAAGAAAATATAGKQPQSSSSLRGASFNNMNDWISSLAKRATKNSTDGTASAGVVILSKEERKQKRAAKKARRIQTKHQQQLQKRRLHTQQASQYVAAVATSKNNENNDNFAELRNRRRLKTLSLTFNFIQKSSKKSNNKDARQKPYISNERPRKKHKPWNQDSIQPRPNDYSGIGLARDSLWVSFLDPSFRPKLEEEFQQHIPGFYGKQRTKAMKKQLDSNMLWRQLANNKIKLGKKYQSMTPDQRIEAMIQSGMV